MCPTLTLVDVITTTDHHIVGMKQISLVKVFLPPFIAWFRLAVARRRPRSIGLRRCPPSTAQPRVCHFKTSKGGEPSRKDIQDFGALLSAFGKYLSYDIQSESPLAP